MRLTLCKIVLLLTAVVALFACSIQAEPDAPATDSKPTAIAHVTLGSLSQLAAVADDLELPLPSFLTAAGLEQMFPFVGTDGMRKELPISLDYLAGGNLQQSQMAVFFFPLAAGHAPIATFVQQGQALGNDAALVNGIPFRRTGNYLIWGGVPDLVTAITPDKLPDVRPDNPLLELTFDEKLFRRVAPKVLEDFHDQQLQQDASTTKSKSEMAGQRIAIDAMTRGLDRLLIRLEKKEDQFLVTTQIEPSPTFTAHEYQKPGLPEGCAFRIDWQPPHDWVRKGLDKCADLSGRDDFFKDAPGGSQQQAAFEELIVRCCNTALDGDAATYGMELLDDGPIFYSVTQSAAPRNVQAEFVDIQQRADALDTKHKKTSELSSYKLDDGTAVSRLVGLDDDSKPEFLIDSVDRAGMRMTTICRTDVHAVDRLLAAKPVGPMNDPATGWIDGKQALSLIAALGKMNGTLSDEDHELLNKVLKDQRINWTVNTVENRLNIIVDVPVQLVKNVTQNTDGLGKVLAKMNTPNEVRN